MYKLLALAVVPLIALSACSGGAEQPAEGAQAQAAAPRVDQPEGAAKDLKEVTCEADQESGEWSFTAKLTNSSDRDSEYTVRVSVVKKEGSTVVGSKEIVQKVAKGETVDLEAERFSKPVEKPDQLACVPTTTVKRG